MGRSPRPKPARLAAKLFCIRAFLGLTQDGMARHLNSNYYKSTLSDKYISEYEEDVKEPPLEVLLWYARAVPVPLEVLVDDEMNLPGDLATLCSITEERIRRKRRKRSSK